MISKLRGIGVSLLILAVLASPASSRTPAPGSTISLERFAFRVDTHSRGIASGVIQAYLWLPRDDHHKHPLILLSHGSGGSAQGVSWIPSGLVRAGYAVAAVDHPGNTSTEPYTPQGFMLWWLRARDISMLLDRILANESFSSRIDASRVGAVGFSLGGYTLAELAGARTDVNPFIAACLRHPAACTPPPMPHLVAQVRALDKSDPEFRAMLAADAQSFADPRIKAFFAIAPAQVAELIPSTVQHIRAPFTIVDGAADVVAPPKDNAQRLHRLIAGSRLSLIPGVTHYQFLDVCTAGMAAVAPAYVCADPPNVSRSSVHHAVSKQMITFFSRTLR